MKKTQRQGVRNNGNKKQKESFDNINEKEKKNHRHKAINKNKQQNGTFKKKEYSKEDSSSNQNLEQKKYNRFTKNRPRKEEVNTKKVESKNRSRFIMEENKYSLHEEVVSSEDWIEGRNSVMEALKAGREINKLLIARGDKEGSVIKILQMARKKGILIQEVDRIKLDTVSGGNHHQGVLAYVSAKEYVDVDDIVFNARERKENPLLLILDGITDPQNFGSILRSAYCAGVHGVIIPQRRSVSLNSTVSKASAGAMEYIPVARVKNIAATIDELKEYGIWIVGTDATANTLMGEADLKGNLAIVIGSEGEGMSRLVREKCDFLVKIPIKGEIASLNAGVACGVILYESLRQRQYVGMGIV